MITRRASSSLQASTPLPTKIMPSKRARSPASDDQNNLRSQKTTPQKAIRTASQHDLDPQVVGECVWVKLNGKAWPAQLVEAKTPEQLKKARVSSPGIRLVRCFGTGKHAYVPIQDICKFGEGSQHEELSKCCVTKKFKEALDEASRVQSSTEKMQSEASPNLKRGSKNLRVRTCKKASTPLSFKVEGTEEISIQDAPNSSTAEEDSDSVDISAYEQLRQENMRRNKAILEALELPSLPIAQLSGAGIKARGLGPKKKETDSVPVRQRSLRIQVSCLRFSSFPKQQSKRTGSGDAVESQGKDSEGHELPASFREPIRFKPGADLSLSEATRERRLGDLSFASCIVADSRLEDGTKVNALAAFLQNLRSLEKLDGHSDSISDFANETSYKPLLSTLTVAERDVAKVVPDRIFSIAFHPTHDKALVFAGDKLGRIGLFDPDGADDAACVTLFDVHSRPVTNIMFDPRDKSKMFSSSYDNTVRMMDLHKEQFLQVHESDEDKWGFLSTAFFDHTRDCLFGGFGRAPGTLSIQDVRGGQPQFMELHERTIRCVDVCPANNNVIMTGSVDGFVKFWDFRKMKKKGCESMWGVEHGKGVTAAYFSANGGLALSTSFDDTVRLLDVEARTQRFSISHNNQTGRWLTPFRACFDPKTNLAFAVGSMSQPRGVDVYSAGTGRLLLRMQAEAFGSVTSLNCFHPSRNMLAGGNSSGKVLLWRPRQPAS